MQRYHPACDEQVTVSESPGKQDHPLFTASTYMMNKKMSGMLNERLQ